MNVPFLIGVVGSLILVIGAAWPIGTGLKHPVFGIKNWLFAIGNILLLIFAVLGYSNGGSVFFVFLEILILGATVLMMLNTPDIIDAAIISLSGIALIIWSLFLFEGYTTLVFVVGLAALGLGYAFQNGTPRRLIALTVGSVLVAAFSYFEANWIFFWLNIFFALFSAYYIWKTILQSNPRIS